MHTIGTDVGFWSKNNDVSELSGNLGHSFYLLGLETSAGQNPKNSICLGIGSKFPNIGFGVYTQVIGTQTDDQSACWFQFVQMQLIPICRVDATLGNALTFSADLTYSYGDAIAYD
jgi:hypothetical protein